MPALQDNATVT